MKDSAWKLFLKLIVDQSAGYRVVISKQPADEDYANYYTRDRLFCIAWCDFHTFLNLW